MARSRVFWITNLYGHFFSCLDATCENDEAKSTGAKVRMKSIELGKFYRCAILFLKLQIRNLGNLELFFHQLLQFALITSHRSILNIFGLGWLATYHHIDIRTTHLLTNNLKWTRWPLLRCRLLPLLFLHLNDLRRLNLQSIPLLIKISCLQMQGLLDGKITVLMGFQLLLFHYNNTS